MSNASHVIIEEAKEKVAKIWILHMVATLALEVAALYLCSWLFYLPSAWWKAHTILLIIMGMTVGAVLALFSTNNSCKSIEELEVMEETDPHDLSGSSEES